MSVLSTILTGTFLISVSRLLRAWALWDRRWQVALFFTALCCGGITAAAITATSKSLVSVMYLTQPLITGLMASRTFLE